MLYRVVNILINLSSKLVRRDLNMMIHGNTISYCCGHCNVVKFSHCSLVMRAIIPFPEIANQTHE
jgi:hypothetical protein